MAVSIVVAASAVAAILFDEPEAEAIFERLAGLSLVAPMLLHYALANVCHKKAKRNPAEQRQILAAFSRRARFLIRHAAVDQDGALRLATGTGLTPYDASYLWLARQHGLEIVTLDRKLGAIAKEVLP